jgi:iron complex outermembrane receptor protein
MQNLQELSGSSTNRQNKSITNIKHPLSQIMKKRLLLLLTLLLSAGFAFAQTAVTGIVKQSNGAAVPNATIKVRGTSISVSADENGRFSIDAKHEPPFYLQISAIGYKAQDFQILKIQDT